MVTLLGRTSWHAEMWDCAYWSVTMGQLTLHFSGAAYSPLCGHPTPGSWDPPGGDIALGAGLAFP